MTDAITLPAPSPRVTGLSASSEGWDVFFRSRALIAAGERVTELTIGEHDVRTDPSILGAMDAAARGGHTGYADIPGVPALRDAVARRITERTGVPTARGNVLITAGGQAALFAAHMAACSPGDLALFIDPYYATYPGTLAGAGAVPVPVPTRSSEGFLPDPATIAARARGAASVLINSPNNPTGGVYGRKTLEGIAEVVKENGLWLISDEVYDTQVWEGEHLSPRALPEMVERTLVIGSMSKSHAMTGSRIGWLVGPEQVISPLIDLAICTTYGVAGFIQDAALFALARGPGFEARIAEPFRRRRQIALEVLEGRPGLRVIHPSAAMYVMIDIRPTGLTGVEFANRLLDERRIAVMPGESFGTSAAGHLRIALTVEDGAFARALGEIADLAGELA